MKIIYGHSADSFEKLKIAGDFSDWKPLSMVRNGEGRWEYVLDPTTLPPDTGKVHFKFIDDNGVWFTDEDYPKEVDEHSNENNVKLLSVAQEPEDVTDSDDDDELVDMDYEGPQSPVPSLKAQEKQNTARSAAEDKDESVGGSAVLVSHSDAEDDRQVAPGSERPTTGETALSGRENNPDQYKDVLARIIAFFTNLFRSWFG